MDRRECVSVRRVFHNRRIHHPPKFRRHHLLGDDNLIRPAPVRFDSTGNKGAGGDDVSGRIELAGLFHDGKRDLIGWDRHRHVGGALDPRLFENLRIAARRRG